ncbi:MAG: hypothetical protein KBC42_02825 [Candidatus Pacebacteria bacterium]|nr:hypothetical protein [Candidatus Paceibacterota bacterium]MBP9780835.1 hypothetical protein [Candidatus Paceibacterota bacterium]
MIRDEVRQKLKNLILEFESDCPEGPNTHSKIRFFYKYGIEFSPRSFHEVKRMSAEEKRNFQISLPK